MSDMRDAIFVLAAFFVAQQVNGWLSNETTVYMHKCASFDQGLFSCKTYSETSKEVFRVDFSKQIVASDDLFFDFVDCKVFDRENWTCKSRKEDWYSASMTKGNLWRRDNSIKTKDGLDEPYKEQINFFRYVFLSAKQYIHELLK